MPSFQLFPVSSLLIGSMLADDTADSDSAFIQLERGWVCDPREADCACLFSLLESILCSVREDSCYYNCALFSLAAFHPCPSFSPLEESLLSREFYNCGRIFYSTWHSIFKKVHLHPKFPPPPYTHICPSSPSPLLQWAELRMCNNTSSLPFLHICLIILRTLGNAQVHMKVNCHCKLEDKHLTAVVHSFLFKRVPLQPTIWLRTYSPHFRPEVVQLHWEMFSINAPLWSLHCTTQSAHSFLACAVRYRQHCSWFEIIQHRARLDLQSEWCLLCEILRLKCPIIHDRRRSSDAILTTNEERYYHGAHAVLILSHAGVIPRHTSILNHQCAHRLKQLVSVNSFKRCLLIKKTSYSLWFFCDLQS